MDIQKYQFYIILGVIVSVYLMVYLLFVKSYGKTMKITIDNEQIKVDNNSLNNKKGEVEQYHKIRNTLPNEDIIKYHKEQKSLLKDNLQKAYQVFQEKDKVLEKWFQRIEKDLEVSGKKLPELYVFQPAYEEEKKALLKKYTDPAKQGLKLWTDTKKADDKDFIEMSKPKTNEAEDILPLVSVKDIVTNSQMTKFQKQFWLIEKFLLILEEGKLKTLTKYKFLNDDWQEGSGKKFVTHSIEISGEVDYADIPVLVNKVLDNPFFMTQITKIDVERDKTYKPELIPVYVPWGWTEEKALEEFFKKNPQKGKLPLAMVTIRCDILDYQGG